MKIDFNEEKHEYSVGGVKVPSVSEILAPLSADRYRDLNPAVLQQAAARGTAIHEATQAIDYGAEPEPNPDLEGYIAAYMSFLLDHNVEWDMIEQIVYYQRFPEEKPVFCGTIDRFGSVDGRKAVVDIKTYASLNTDGMISASCQTALYASALESMGVDADARYLLHLKKDGKYRLVDLYKFDYERGFLSYDVGWQLVFLHEELEAARKTVRKKRAV